MWPRSSLYAQYRALGDDPVDWAVLWLNSETLRERDQPVWGVGGVGHCGIAECCGPWEDVAYQDCAEVPSVDIVADPRCPAALVADAAASVASGEDADRYVVGDHSLRVAVAASPHCPTWAAERWAVHPDRRVRTAIAANPALPGHLRAAAALAVAC